MTLRKKSIRILLLALVVAALCVVPAFASSSAGNVADAVEQTRSEEHTSELQSHHSIAYAVFCLKKKFF